MKPSPVLTGLRTYPFVRLTDAKRELLARGVPVIDFGVGEPREDTPAFIREALAAALEPKSTYPLAEGLPVLRAAVAGWIERRFGPALDPDTEVIPTFGSKEAIFHLAQVVGGDLVAVTAPAYPVAERGAAFAGKQVLELPLAAERGFLPDLGAVDAATWERTAILWLNYPNNPTAATAPLELYEQAAAIAREHDVVVASDEAYSEIYFGPEPPVSALQVADRRNVIALNTLSKRSSMPGYRSGFVAGDPEVIAALKRYRPNVGVAPPRVHPARGRRRLGRRGPRRGRARALPRQARRAAAGLRGRRHPPRRRRRDVLPLARRRRARRRAGRRAARARHRARPRLVLRPRRRGLPAARARPDARRVRARRGAAAVSRWRAGRR